MIYISYKIEAIENLKISSSGNQHDTDYSIGYIPGPSLRGAFIRNYINKFNISNLEEDTIALELFLKGKMKFLNAYPIRDYRRTVPHPINFYASKDSIKMFNYIKSKGRYLSGDIINELDGKVKEDYKNIRLGEFVLEILDEDIKATNVEKIQTMHISKRKDKNEIFRYESIKAGEKFEAYIAFEGNEEEAKEYVDILKDKTVFLGGSKGSGYGKCKIYDVEILHSNPEISDIDYEDMDFDDELYLYSLSDLIYINDNGELTSYVDKKFLEEKLGVDNIELEKASVENTIVSGYNNKWGTMLPQYKAIKAGSIFKYTFDGEIDIDKLTDFINEGIGLRTEEGYGRFLIIDSFSASSFSIYAKRNDKVRVKDISSAEKVELKNILEKIFALKVERQVDSYVYELTKTLRINGKASNQLGKVLQNVINSMSLEPSEGKAKLKAYMDHLSYDEDGKERKNKNALNKLEKISIGDKKFNKYLDEIFENITNINYFIENIGRIKLIKIGEVEINIDEDFVYNHTLNMLEKLLRFMLRVKEDK